MANLLGLPVYQKNHKRKPRNSPPTKAERERWERVRALGCSVCQAKNPEIHHCCTGAGGRKDHAKVIGLCRKHHTGSEGIHFIGRRTWQERFGAEQQHLERVAHLNTP